MLMYLLIIALCAAAIITGNYFFAMPDIGFPLWLNFVGVLSSILAVIALDGIIASVCHKLQGGIINPSHRYFHVSPKEKRLLEKLGVRRFKNFLPDLGKLVKFPKGTIADPRNKDYLYRYILESCSGEVNHVASMFLGFLIIFIFPLKYFLCFGVPVAAVNLVLNFLPVMSLRYNRFRLTHIYNKLESRETAESLITASAGNGG